MGGREKRQDPAAGTAAGSGREDKGVLSGRVLESDEIPPPWSGVRLTTVRRRYSTLMTCAQWTGVGFVRAVLAALLAGS